MGEFDGIAQIWFNDLTSRAAAAASPEGKRWHEDGATIIGAIRTFVTKEQVMVPLLGDPRPGVKALTAIFLPTKPACGGARTFQRNISVDYSGVGTPTASLKGLRVYLAEGDATPTEVLPLPSPRKCWTRRGIVEWLAERQAEELPTLVGIDHGFSFPLRYFEAHSLLPDWPIFLDVFQRHWSTDEDHSYIDSFATYHTPGRIA